LLVLIKIILASVKVKFYKLKNMDICIIHFEDLMTAKKASGRFKDKNDIEQLSKKKKQ